MRQNKLFDIRYELRQPVYDRWFGHATPATRDDPFRQVVGGMTVSHRENSDEKALRSSRITVTNPTEPIISINERTMSSSRQYKGNASSYPCKYADTAVDHFARVERWFSSAHCTRNETLRPCKTWSRSIMALTTQVAMPSCARLRVYLRQSAKQRHIEINA